MIKAYEPLIAELGTLKEVDEATDFDYVEDNKAARSHVYRFRQFRKVIDTTRKTEKAESLAYGRAVDSEAKAIVADVDAIIERHAAPLQAIEDAEKARKDAILHTLNWLKAVATPVDAVGDSHGSNYLMSELAAVQAIVVEESEYTGAVQQAKDAAVELLTKFVADAKAREKQDAEMAVIREKQAEADRLAERKRIEDEGAKRVIAKAQADAKAAHEKAQADAKAAQEKADRATKEAEEKHARELRQQQADADQRELALKLEAEAKERERLQARLDARKATEAAAADEKNRARVHDDIRVYLLSLGCTPKTSQLVVGGIASGLVPHITVDYSKEST